MKNYLVGALIIASASVAKAQGNPAMAALRDSVEKTAPTVGTMAPQFTAVSVGATVASAKPVKLSDYKGKVVVLAFYPADKSSGCTAQLTKFRDEHATIFGSDVVLLPLSTDSVAMHATWSSEMKFPFPLLVDSAQAVSKLYGSAIPGRATDSRTVWVIGKDGTILYRNMRFQALNETAYTELAAEVAKAKHH
jgi:thioredoxin-dependent peroxiredoxin